MKKEKHNWCPHVRKILGRCVHILQSLFYGFFLTFSLLYTCICPSVCTCFNLSICLRETHTHPFGGYIYVQCRFFLIHAHMADNTCLELFLKPYLWFLYIWILSLRAFRGLSYSLTLCKQFYQRSAQLKNRPRAI